MIQKSILINIFSALFLITQAGCRPAAQQTTQQEVEHNIPVVANHSSPNIAGVTLIEDFEESATAKASYAIDEAKFASGTWLLDDALNGTSKADAKNGRQSVRVRNKGRLSMQFDVKCGKQISISHAVYGHDGPSSWQLWVSADRGNTYHQVDQTITTAGGTLKTAFFKNNGTGELRFEIRKTTGGNNRINIDDINFNASAPDSLLQVKLPGKKELQNVGGDNSHLLFGNPSGATASINNEENYLIDQKYYIESYSRSKAIPNWVCWHINSSDLGTTDRLNNFRPDTTLPAQWYEVDDTSYKGSGFDKGHNCPSGDRTSSSAANSSTFLMNNMIPQAPNNNQRTWEHLESYCRGQVKKGNEVYVIMGSYGTGGTGKNGYYKTIDNGRINVPSHIWKVVVIIPNGNNDLQRIDGETRIIAVDTPNDNSIAPNWMNYLCTVRDIEKATGYNLLSALPKSLQDIVEIKKFAGGN